MQKPNVIELKTTARETGSLIADKHRNEKLVPSVVYGPELKENVHFSVSETDLEKILSVKHIQIIKLILEDGKTIDTILKKTDFHPVSDRPIHADFYALSENYPVTLTVPLETTGTSAGVVEGGRLFRPMRSIRIKCTPSQIPANLSIDISSLSIGSSLHVRDLNLEGITPLVDLSRTIATVNPPRGGLKGLEPEVEEEELAEEEDGETQEQEGETESAE